MYTKTKPANPNRDFQRIVLDKLRIIRNGHITVIKQDGRVIQIDVCDRFSTGSGPEESFDPPRNNPVNFYENLEGGY